MACITLTRQQITPRLDDRCVPGWRVAWEGRHVADWHDLADGRMTLLRRTALNAALREAAGEMREPQEFGSLEALREWYLRSAEAFETRVAGG